MNSEIFYMRLIIVQNISLGNRQACSRPLQNDIPNNKT